MTSRMDLNLRRNYKDQLLDLQFQADAQTFASQTRQEVNRLKIIIILHVDTFSWSRYS